MTNEEKAFDRRMTQVYSDALTSAVNSLSSLRDKMKNIDALQKKLPASYTEEQIKRWRQGFIREAIRQSGMIDRIAQELKKAGGKVSAEIQAEMARVYQAGREEVSGMLPESVRGSFSMYSEEQVSMIMRDSQTPFEKMAYVKLADDDLPLRRLQSEMAQATILGESQDQIIRRIRTVTGQSVRQARTVAQTERTRIQSQSRQTALSDAAKLGVNVKKRWSATGVNTRDTHLYLDGMVVNEGEPFISSSGAALMYPGDPSAPAEEVINCHCVLVPVVEGPEEVKDVTAENPEEKPSSYENPETGLKYQYTYGKISAGDEVITPDEKTAVFEKWVRGSKAETIAGHGTEREIDDIDRIVRDHKGLSDQWIKQKREGIITVTDENGNEETGIVSFHWYYEPSAGIVERKIKVDEQTMEWFYPEP